MRKTKAIFHVKERPTSRNKKFGPVRRAALSRWFRESKRFRCHRDRDDNFSNSFECQWQGRAQGSIGHVSLFCGIGEWGCHVTDILSDRSNDNLCFDRKKDERRLARHYWRFSLVVAELLNDLEDALGKIKVDSPQQEKRLMLGHKVQDFQIFLNKVIKHKAQSLHYNDRHLPLLFEDGGIKKALGAFV